MRRTSHQGGIIRKDVPKISNAKSPSKNERKPKVQPRQRAKPKPKPVQEVKQEPKPKKRRKRVIEIEETDESE